MKPFHFSLETLLKVRQEKEEQASKDLATASEGVQQAIDRRQTFLESKSQAEALIRAKSGSIAAGDLLVQLDYWQGIEEQLVACEREISRLREIESEKRETLAQAAKERKVVQNLKDKQQAQWKEENEKASMAMADEQATLRYTERSFSRGETRRN